MPPLIDGEWAMSRIGATCLAASLAGWMLVLLVAVFLPGGHPPALAYLFVPVALTTTAVSTAGVAASIRSIRTRSEPGLFDYGALVGNALVVAFVVVWALIHAFAAIRA